MPEFHHEVSIWQAAQKPAALLAEVANLSQQQVKQAMQKGAVWLSHGGHTRRLRRHKTKLKAGDKLHLYWNPELLASEPLSAELIADEGSFSVWNKPAGMRSQGSKWSDHTSLPRYAERTLDRPTFLVHRLDSAANGLILVAHSKGMARQLTQLFEQRQIEKYYRVQVHGKFPETPQHFEQVLDDKPALSEAVLIDYDPEQSISTLEVRIHTGRKHQIRRHLSDAGFPVVGDRRYGQSVPVETATGETATGATKTEDTKNGEGALALAAVLLRFRLPEQTDAEATGPSGLYEYRL